MTLAHPAAAPLGPDGLRVVADEVRERGVSGPVRLLSPGRAWRLAWLLRVSGSPGVWDKDRAVGSAAYHRVATEPAIVSLVQGVLGPDVLLWGAALAVRRPGRPHRWHNDRETVGVGGQSVVVWLPLRNSGPSSSLVVVPGSHRLEETVQQLVAEAGLGADTVTDEHVRTWAEERGMEAVDRPVARPGEAVVFDSGLWHATVNETDRTRVALLLQYATPETEVRIPPTGNFNWPFERSEQRAPCLLVSGSDRVGVNEIVDPPDGGCVGGTGCGLTSTECRCPCRTAGGGPHTCSSGGAPAPGCG